MKLSEQCPKCGRKMHHRVDCKPPVKRRVKPKPTAWDHILKGRV